MCAQVVKNKVAPPYKIAEFDIMFGSGISGLGCLLDAAEAVGIVAKRGSWYYYGEDKLAQGRDKTLAELEERPEVAKCAFCPLHLPFIPISSDESASVVSCKLCRVAAGALLRRGSPARESSPMQPICRKDEREQQNSCPLRICEVSDGSNDHDEASAAAGRLRPGRGTS